MNSRHSRPARGLFRGTAHDGLICLMAILTNLMTILSFVHADEKTPGKPIPPRAGVPSVHVSTFRQQVRTNYTTDDGLPEGPIHQLAFDQQLFGKTDQVKILAATEKGIASFSEGRGNRWKVIHETKTPIIAVLTAHEQTWFIQDDQVIELSSAGQTKLIAKAPADVSLRSLLRSGDELFVGTSAGLFVIDNGALLTVKAVNRLLGDLTEVRQLAAFNQEIVLATAGGLVSHNHRSGETSLLTPRDAQAGWALQDVRGVGFDQQGGLWFAAKQGVGQRTTTGWKLLTGHEGLPYNDFTCLATGPRSDVWFGTRIGAIRYTPTDWEYRQGKRWLADDQVSSIVVTPSGDAWFATPAGITRIETRPTTLREKSAFFNREIDLRHKRTPFGYVDAVALAKPGETAKWTQQDSDNDGLWTSMYGAAQCFEYASTHSEESRKRANDAFRAVAFLSEVTQGGAHPAPFGFPARTILPVSGRNPNDHDNPAHDQKRQQKDPLWKVLAPRWPVSADGQWYWKTDTSSDELDGHYFFYALYNDLVATTDAEKQYVRTVVDRVTTHLIDHDYTLVDHDGKPTRWGQFSPSAINTDFMTDLRGLNALSILSYLLVAEHVTGDPKYRREYEKLLFEHNYFTNVLTPKYQNGPGAGNQSDDEMAFMCYYNLLTYEKNPKIRLQYLRSLSRYFLQEEPEMCPLFNLIFASFYDHVDEHWDQVPASVITDSVETLQRYPLDRVNWGHRNSHRLDIIPLAPHVLEAAGKGYRRNGKVLPFDEQFVNQWNHDSWRLNQNSAGSQLADGTSFLLPYWLGVYRQLITEDR